MPIRPKSSEELQAQAASYAAELESQVSPEDSTLDFEQQLHALDISGKIYDGLGEAAVLSQVFNDMPEERADYADFLRRTKRSAPEVITKRMELARTYEQQFSEPVRTLYGELAANDSEQTRRAHPSYMGHGSYSDVFRIEKEGKPYVAKIPRLHDADKGLPPQLTPPERVNHYVTAAIRGQGLRHLEQVVGISYADGTIITELMPGKDANHFTAADRAAMTDEQIAELVDTLVQAEQAGVTVELLSGGNLFYDAEAGFGFIDYYSVDHPRRHNLEYTRSREDTVGSIFNVLRRTALNKDEEAEQCEALYHRIKDIFQDKGFYEEGEADYL